MVDPAQVQEAFADLHVQVPALGFGTYKLAFQATWNGQDVVLKMPMRPLPDETDDEEEQEIEVLPATYLR